MYAVLDCLQLDNHCILYRSSQTSLASWICHLLTVTCIGKLLSFSEFTRFHFRFLSQHLSNVNAISSMARPVTSVMQMPRFISRHRNIFHVYVSVRYHCLFQETLPAIFSATSCPACVSLQPLVLGTGMMMLSSLVITPLSPCFLPSAYIQAGHKSGVIILIMLVKMLIYVFASVTLVYVTACSSLVFGHFCLYLDFCKSFTFLSPCHYNS